MLCLARLMRWAMVASGTRNALAISAVVKPPTARSVSAIADGGVSAGWQHMNSSASVSSCAPAASRSGAGRQLLGVARPRNLFAAPPGGLAAHVVGHAPRRDLDQPAARVVGHAVARPLHGGRDQRFLHRVLGGGEVAVAPHDGAEHLRRQLAQQLLGVADSRCPP